MKPTIFLDFDGVIVDSKKSFVDFYNKHYKEKQGYVFADHKKCNKWNFSDVCPLAIDDIQHIFGQKELFDNLEFFPHAKETIEELSKDYKVVIVSIGTYDNIHHKSMWIKNNLSCVKDSILLVKTEGDMLGKSIVDMKGGIFVEDVSKNLYSTNADIKIIYGPKYSWNEDWEGLWASDWKALKNFF